MKTAIVTGASGFIGKALANKLAKDGKEVFAVTKRPGGVFEDDAPNARQIVCDFDHYSTLHDVLPKNADVFVHFAWAGVSGADSKDPAIQANDICAAVAAMQQAIALNVKAFVFAGTSYQFRMEPVVKDGKKIFVRKNIYGVAKEAAANMMRAISFGKDVRFNTVLFTNVFGVGDGSNRSANSIIGQLLEGKDLNLISGEHLHDWTYVDDAVDGILAVAERGVDGKTYYVGNRKLKPFKEIITAVANAVRPEAKLNFGAYVDDGYIDYSSIDLDALYRDTGFECKTEFAESIRKTAEWLKKIDEDKNLTNK